MDEREVPPAGPPEEVLERLEPSRPGPAPTGRGRLVLVAAACVLLVVGADLGYGRWRASAGVGDGDLVLLVRQAHVVDLLAPGMTSARVDATVENATSTPVTVTAASFAGFAQVVSASVPAHGSAPLTLLVQVACSSGSPPLSTAATLTVAAPGGAPLQVTAHVVESGTADQLMAECRQKALG